MLNSTHGNYPDWDHCVHLYMLVFESERCKVTECDLSLLFNCSLICRDDPKLLAEILACILISCELTSSIVQFSCAVFLQLWMWLFHSGIGADDGLALLEFRDLNFPMSAYPDLGKLFYKEALFSIIEVVQVLQGLPYCLYLDRRSHFSVILHHCQFFYLLSPPAFMQHLPMHAVTFDLASVKLSTACHVAHT